MMPVSVDAIAHRLNASKIINDDPSTDDKSPLKQSHKFPKSQSFYQRLKFTSSAAPSPVDDQPKCADLITANPDELKGVQTLKQFWINAFGSVRGRSRRTRAHTDVRDSVAANRGWRKCATLSVAAASMTTSNESRDSDAITGDVRKCTTLHRNFVTGSAVDGSSSIGETPVVSTVKTEEPVIGAADRRLSNVSSCADNFYKYKTADMVRQQQHHNTIPAQPVFALSTTAVGAAATGGCTQIHWAKRADVIVTGPDASHKQESSNDAGIGTEKVSVSDHNDKSQLTDSDARATDNRMKGQSDSKDDTNTTNTTANTMTMATSTTPQSTVPDVGHKTPAAAAISNSSSISSSGQHTSGGGVTRKCSFRTNAYQPNNRKMAASGAGSVGSKVAALTHRFNQLCSQQDARSLIGDEMRPCGVIVHRSGGRVFRVMKEDEMVKRSGSSRSSADNSPVRTGRKRGSVKRRDSRAKKRPDTLPAKKASTEPLVTADAVTDHIEVIKVKPKVPDKSAQVLLRTKEIVKRNLTKNAMAKETGVRKEDAIPKLTPLTEFKEEDRKESIVYAEPIRTDSAAQADATTSKSANEENPKKNKYARIYEKFRPSFLYQKKPALPSQSETQSPTEERSVKKIIDAISAASQRIENLSKSESCLLATTTTTPIREEDIDDYAGPMKPNQSFLYRSTVFNVASPNSSCLVEAINPCVLTKTQSMDEMRFRHSFKLFAPQTLLEGPEPLTETETNPEQKGESIENEYEFIQPPAVEVSASEHFAKTAKKTAPVCTLYAAPTKPDNVSVVVANPSSQATNTSPVDCSDIYQSIAEVFNTNLSTIGSDRRSISSYESFGTYQTVDEGLLERIKNENGYEICEHTDPPPEPPPPRQTGPAHRSPSISANTAPPLPMPKRACNNYVLQTSDSMASSNYEHIKYDKQPPRPPKSCPSPTAKQQQTGTDLSSPETEYDEENIYDTIKPRHRNGTAAPNGGSQTVGGIDYESIESHTSFLRPKRVSKCSADSDTASTLSSDNKTNSLYGTAMSRRDSVSRPPSEGGDNSDDWVDISDGESETMQRDRFVVVCERKRGPRNADWCRKVRDQRQNKSASEYYEDDSDHYYESLDPTVLSDDGNVTPAAMRTDYDQMTNLVKTVSTPNDGQKPSSVETNVAAGLIEEDYDSFDSDEESDEEVRKNDSGVDVSNNRLPDPPTPTNQVYAFMQKIRNFGSLSKNLSKFSKRKTSKSDDTASSYASLSSPTQTYENTQFYVDMTNPKPSQSRSKTPTPGGKKSLSSASEDAYENTEFHAPPNLAKLNLDPATTATTPLTSNASKTTATTPDPPTTDHKRTFGRKKSTSIGTTGKSFKSKFRKSLGPESNIDLGSSFNAKRSTFYVIDSPEMDSGVFTNPTPPATTAEPAAAQRISVHETRTSTDTLPTTTPDGKSIIVTTPEVSQRKSSLTVRPLNPPPPPPVDRRSSSVSGGSGSSGSTSALKNKRLLGTTSWYAECGVFKSSALQETGNDDHLETQTVGSGGGSNIGGTSTPTGKETYADAGVYQTSGSVASSSGSSGVSTGGSGDDHSHSMFLNEPLYQIYSAAKLESISHDIEMDTEEHSDGYEEVGGTLKRTDGATGASEKRQPVRPTALQLVGPKQGPSRTLWCEIPEVINSQILSTLTLTEKRLQEAKFEILTSEASYLKSLTLLRTHFMNHPAFRDAAILSAADRKTLFSYMVAVQECSDRLLCDLENCWQDNIMLSSLSHSLYKHAEKYFHVYVAYCEHQGKLDRTLKRLKEPKTAPFYQTLCQLESDAACCGLSLHSFLMLPMQRITRLPLLVDAVFGKLRPDDDEHDSWRLTLRLVSKIVSQCNEAANRSAQAHELQLISRQIEFPQSIRPLPIVPVGTGKLAHRALVRSGELTHIVWRGDDGKLTFGKRFSRTTMHAFLFTDLLVLARRRDGGQYLVADYCERQLLTVASGDVIPQLPTKDVPLAGKHLICMTLLENHEGKMTEMIFSCPTETDRQRWLHATEPPASDNPDEKLYEQWDCPQVICKHPYIALQPDELGLDGGDVVNVTRKMADGWYQGERLRDGQLGWFPGNYTDEVASAHVRARNLKQRYRLLNVAYYEAQKRK